MGSNPDTTSKIWKLLDSADGGGQTQQVGADKAPKFTQPEEMINAAKDFVKFKNQYLKHPKTTWLKQKFGQIDSEYAQDFYNLLDMLNGVLGDYLFVKHLDVNKRYLNYLSKNPSEQKASRKAFKHKLINGLMDKYFTNGNADFSGFHYFLRESLLHFQSDETLHKYWVDNPLPISTRHMVSKDYKKRINNFGESMNMPKRLAKVPASIVLKNVIHDAFADQDYATHAPQYVKISDIPNGYQLYYNNKLYADGDTVKISDLSLLELVPDAGIEEKDRSKECSIHIACKKDGDIDSRVIYLDDLPFKYEHEPYHGVSEEKQAIRDKKPRWSKFSLFFAFILSLTQSVLGAYALLGLGWPLFLVIPLLVLCGGSLTYANTKLFFYDNFDFIKRYFLFKDGFKGFETVSGKILLGLLFTAALLVAIGVAGLSVLSLASIFAFPPLSLALLPILAYSAAFITLGIPAIIGFTCLMFAPLKSLALWTCKKIDIFFPTVAKAGWGFTGLCFGIFFDLVTLKTAKIVYSEIKKGLQSIWDYFKYPFGKDAEDAMQAKIAVLLKLGTEQSRKEADLLARKWTVKKIAHRVSAVTGKIVTLVACVLVGFLFVKGMMLTLGAMGAEMSTFLGAQYLGLSSTLNTIITTATIYIATTIVDGIFSLSALRNFTFGTAKLINDYVVTPVLGLAAAIVLAPIAALVYYPLKFTFESIFSSIFGDKSAEDDKLINKDGDVINRAINEPLQRLDSPWAKYKHTMSRHAAVISGMCKTKWQHFKSNFSAGDIAGSLVSLAVVGFAGLNALLLCFKGVMQPGQDTLHMSDIDRSTMTGAVAAAGESAAINKLALDRIDAETPSGVHVHSPNMLNIDKPGSYRHTFFKESLDVAINDDCIHDVYELQDVCDFTNNEEYEELVDLSPAIDADAIMHL